MYDRLREIRKTLRATVMSGKWFAVLARHATNGIVKDFMLSLSRSSVLRKSGLCLFAILTVSGEFRGSASPPPPVPKSFQDLYNSLNNSLDSFNTTLNSQWNGVKRSEERRVGQKW